MKKIKGYRQVSILGNTYYWKLDSNIKIFSNLNNKKIYYKHPIDDYVYMGDWDSYVCVTPSDICELICKHILHKTNKEIKIILSAKKTDTYVKIKKEKTKYYKTFNDYKKEYEEHLTKDVNPDNIQYLLIFSFLDLDMNDNIIYKEKVINCFSDPKYVKSLCKELNTPYFDKQFIKYLIPDYNDYLKSEKLLLKNKDNFKNYKSFFSSKVLSL